MRRFCCAHILDNNVVVPLKFLRMTVIWPFSVLGGVNSTFGRIPKSITSFLKINQSSSKNLDCPLIIARIEFFVNISNVLRRKDSMLL